MKKLVFIILLLIVHSECKCQTAEDYLNAGISKRSKSDFVGAMADFTKAINLNPKLKEAFFNRGICKLAQNDNINAITDFSKAIEIDPNYFKAYSSRGLARYNLQFYDSALDDFTRAIQINPNYAEAYNNRGIIKILTGKNGCADLIKAIELGHNSARESLNEYCK